MLDLGWTEILVIGVVALIVIGPRDLPVALHTLGKYVGKMKAMARDFQHGIDEIARQHELKELQQSVQKFGSAEEAIENYIGGLENQGSKIKAKTEPKKLEAAGTGEPAGKPEDGDAASADPASPAALEHEDSEQELPLGAGPEKAVAPEPPKPEGPARAETASDAPPEPKPGQTTAS